MSINKIILLGSLGKDPIYGATKDGKEYANFSLATSKKWKDKNGDKQEKTLWHNISCWGSLVKVCNYLEKGSKIYIEGEIEYGSYKNKEGVEIPSVKINARVLDIIKGKTKDGFDGFGDGFRLKVLRIEELSVEEDLDDALPF